VTDKRARDDKAIEERRRIIAGFFEESGEIAPIDFRYFGKRVGEIIAQSAHTQRKTILRRQH
jgi:hypothetical protein